MGVTLDITKMLAFSPPGRAPTEAEIIFLTVVDVSKVIKNTGITVRVPVGSHTLFEWHTLGVVGEVEK